ncbi:ABC transporter substrate-binding protein [Pseudonocardia benzenivorans]|uniref:ABC transporter substrate-binding protein n=1 Tax=Pseudonocardia benzenivorans TaxID=228005 RepID=A0ABW3VLP5_9PSEU|nr:4,5-dihydroxyphthalate decarboxylase [Pseudonocardia sp. D17]
MTPNVPLTYAGAVYDRTRPLYDGSVRAEGVDLRYLKTGIEELFWRQGRYHEFDAAEFSFGAYLAVAELPDRPFDAIPVFPSRAFRHSALYVRADSDVEKPDQLSGRIVGTPEWSMTASLWMRGILGEYYGVDLTSVRWRTGGLEEPGRQEKSRVTPPERFDVTRVPEDATLVGQLLDGALDALLTARPPQAFMEGDPRIRRLFPDFRGAELEYHRATGIVPIMHVVVIKRDILAQHPWVANNLRRAFELARGPATADLRDTAVCSSSLLWESAYAEQEAAMLGDPFAYGIEANRATLDTILRYAAEQGFTSRPLPLNEVFLPSTLTDAKI